MFFYKQGVTTQQGHKGIPDGHYEEEQGHKGFFGAVSHLIKREPSTRWLEIEGPLRPHMYDLVPLMRESAPQRLLFNAHLEIGIWSLQPGSCKDEAFRNADGDLMLFCHQGEGAVLSEYGLLPYRAGSYILIPKSLTYTIQAQSASSFLMIESRSTHFEEPDRGPLGRNGLYDQNAFGLPSLSEMQKYLADRKSSFKRVFIKRLDQVTRFGYGSCVFSDVVGWKGDLYPVTLHIDQIMPIMSHRVHLPPSAHATFVTRDFVVCTFLPRPLESDADALKVPFYHQNIDYDEVIFYHDGDFFSRDNLHAGMLSLHPAGFPHGPHPKAVKSIGQKTHTSEKAVMIDSRVPLEIDPKLAKVENSNYWKSWSP